MIARTERSSSKDNEGWCALTVESPWKATGGVDFPLVAGQLRQVYSVEITEDVPRPMRWLAKMVPFLRSDMECVEKGGVYYLIIHKTTPFTRKVSMKLLYREQ